MRNKYLKKLMLLVSVMMMSLTASADVAINVNTTNSPDASFKTQEYDSRFDASNNCLTNEEMAPSKEDYSKMYLTIASLEADNTIYWMASDSSLTKTISASTDNGQTWTAYTSSTVGSGTTIATLNTGEKVLLKGTNSAYASNAGCYNRFLSTKKYNAYGNIMSLLYGDNFVGQTTLTSDCTFLKLFFQTYRIVSAENLILPATTLTRGCYDSMFFACQYLVTAPELPATTLARSCYVGMFWGCHSLTTAPELPATTLAPACYANMFEFCSSLIVAPSILPATTLATQCYYCMFDGCSSLNYIKCLATDISATDCTFKWLDGVASSGTFVKANGMNDWPTGDSGIPTNWTVQNAGIEVNATNFPDAEFRSWIMNNISGASDGWLTDAEIAEVKEINCKGTYYKRGSLVSLQGIEFFTSLTQLACSYNQLTSLDVSKNTALTNLECGSNQLTSLDVSKNIFLEKLYCESNKLASLDVSKNTTLKTLSCYRNQLTSLDVGKNTALYSLDCGSNPLASLDVSKNTALYSLECGTSQLTNLDISMNLALHTLFCENNFLTSLDVSKNTALFTLYCGNNWLTSLDVSENSALGKLHCPHTLLTSLDVSKNTTLYELICHSNQLTSLNLGNNTELYRLECYSNLLTCLDLSKNSSIESASIGSQFTSSKAVSASAGIAIPMTSDFDFTKVSNLKLDGTSVSGSLTTVNGQKYLVFAQAGTAQSSIDGKKLTFDYSTGNSFSSAASMDVTVSLSYDAPVTYTLSIQSGSGGSVSYEGTTVTNTTKSFTVVEGTSATISIMPNSGYKLSKLTVNGTNVTSSVSNNQYAISNITANTSIIATFEPINPNIAANPVFATTDAALKLYDYMREQYGQKVISSVMANVNWNNELAENVYKLTKKYPAAVCYDFIHICYSPANWIDYSNINPVKAWSDAGGIVQLMWHFNVPKSEGSTDYTCTPSETTFKVQNVFTNGSWENRWFYEQMDKVVATLLKLQDAGIAATWRPFHEAAGNATAKQQASWTKSWFWWGYDGADTYKRLWRTMFDYFKQKGVKNLIWIWTTQNYNGNSANYNQDTDWYPGDEYVDIVGRDLYGYTAEQNLQEFNEIQATYPTKMIALAECGYGTYDNQRHEFANISDCWNTGAHWSHFMVWYQGGQGSTNSMMTDGWWKDAMQCESVITRDQITYSLSVQATGNGIVTYNGVSFKDSARTFTVNNGSSATLIFTPDNGCRVACVKMNGTDVTSKVTNNQYTINSINAYTSVAVTFEAIPQTTYTLNISATGNGSASYSGETIRSGSKSFTLDEGANATIAFTPDNGYRIASVKVNNTDVTSQVKNNQYTVSSISANTTVAVTFEAIPPTTYQLTISASGNGEVSYSGETIRNGNKSFTLNEGTNATISFTPDNGYRIASLIVNNADVTSKVANNQYTVSSIQANTTVSVTFEEIPPTTYMLSIMASGNGSVTYDGTTVRNQTHSFTINEGSFATLLLSPDDGYHVASIIVNSVDVTSAVEDNQYTVSNIKANTVVSVSFEEIPPTTYTLSITASGNGSIAYDGTTARNQTRTFTLVEGSSAVLTFTPDNGHRIASAKVNGSDVTAQITNHQYTINNISANTSVEAAFAEIEYTSIDHEGLNYRVVSNSNKTVSVANGSYGYYISVPASFTENYFEWTVTGMDDDVLSSNPQLAAVIWNPSTLFTGSIDNPNFLLYVKSSQYAPSSVKNVVINGTAEEITLTDAANGNNFYCPQEFTAKQISYTHYYSMTTGIETAQGWESIALPFDVQSITHPSKGTLVPFANWRSGSSERPFWLYQLSGNGFVVANSIQANRPYIISLPNNSEYREEYRVNGVITFSATDATVKSSENLQTGSYSDRTFIPNFINQNASNGFYVLNAINNYSTNAGGYTEGSRFVRNLRTVHPFEAYITIAGGSAKESIPIFDDETTWIKSLSPIPSPEGEGGVYNLSGQQIRLGENHSTKNLKKGVYIVDGKKIVIR